MGQNRTAWLDAPEPSSTVCAAVATGADGTAFADAPAWAAPGANESARMRGERICKQSKMELAELYRARRLVGHWRSTLQSAPPLQPTK